MFSVCCGHKNRNNFQQSTCLRKRKGTMFSFSEVLMTDSGPGHHKINARKVGSQDQTLHCEKEDIFIHTSLSSLYSTCWNISSSKMLLITWPRNKYAPLSACSQVEYKGYSIPVKALFQGDLYSHYRLLPFLCKFVIKYSKYTMTNNLGNYC